MADDPMLSQEPQMPMTGSGVARRRLPGVEAAPTPGDTFVVPAHNTTLQFESGPQNTPSLAILRRRLDLGTGKRVL